MDFIEIKDTIDCLTADLSLYRCGINDISLTTLKKLSDVLKDNRMDFEREVFHIARDKATEYFLRELYYSLTEYSSWYTQNYEQDSISETSVVAKTVFENIEVIWRPLIEELFPKFIDNTDEEYSNDPDDPEGYNRKYGRPGEKYRSIRYDITENPDFPHLTKLKIFDRLQGIVSEMPNDGADISRLISLAFKHKLLERTPQRKSIIRELGMKSSEESLTELISSRDDEISYSKRLESMKEKLLRK